MTRALLGRRLWSIRGRALDGAPAVIGIGVHEETGAVGFRVGESTVVLDPRDVARLRQTLGDVLAQALTDRGTW